MRALRTLLAAIALLLLIACAENKTADSAPTPKAPDEAAAIAAMREIVEAQKAFIGHTRRYAQTIDELIEDHQMKAKPKKSEIGYDFLMLPSPDAVSYTLTATPASAGARGIRRRARRPSWRSVQGTRRLR